MLVGRENERESLQRALKRASSGQTTLLTIEGEAGLGKSTMLSELAKRAAELGFRCVQGNADEFERNRPFGALLGAISRISDAVDLRTTVSEMLGATPDLATPLVLAAVPDLRHQIIDTLCALIEQLALEGPLLVMIDDVHWSDASTLLALRSMSRRVEGYRLIIAVAGRPNQGEREWSALVNAANESLIMKPLDRMQRHQLVRGRLGSALGPNLTDLVDGTAGNPLLLDQLVRGLSESDLRVITEGTVDVTAGFVPSTFSSAIARSMALVSPLTAEVLRAAAVLGNSASLVDVARMIGRSSGRLLTAIDEGVRAGMLSPDGPELAFRHALVRDAVASAIPPVIRAALHREAADSMKARNAPAARIAFHLQEGGSANDSELRVWLRRAADDAMGRSPAVAHELLQRARRHLDPSDPEWIDLAVADLEATANSGMLLEAEALGKELLALPMPTNQRALVRWWFGGALFLQQRSLEAANLFEVAAEEFDAPERKALLLAYSAMARLASFSPSTTEAVERAVAAAEADGDPQAVSLALSLKSRVFGSVLRFTEALEPALRAVKVADSDPLGLAHRFQPSWFLALALSDMGRPDDALDVIAFGRRHSAAAGASWAEALYHGLHAMVLYGLGRDEDADAEASAGIASADETGSQIAILWSHSVAGLVAIRQNRLVEAEAAIAAGEAAFAAGQGQIGIDLVALGRARLHALAGRVEEARIHLEQSWELFEATTIEVSNAELAIDLVDLATRTNAGDVVEMVLSRVRDWVTRDPLSTRSLAIARACEAIANNDHIELYEAANLFRSAKRVGVANDVETIVQRLAGDDLWRVSASDPAGSPDPRSGALATQTRTPVAPTLDFDGLIPSELLAEAPPGWSSLSPAEQRVCLAVGRGLSNKAIAAELFLSIRTVETHVSRILRKMNASSRLKLGLMVRPVLAAE